MSAQIAAPTPGDYVLRVLNFASVASSYTLTATLFDSRTVDSREVPGLIENWTLTCEKDGRVLRAGRRRPRSAGKVDVDLRQALDHWAEGRTGRHDWPFPQGTDRLDPCVQAGFAEQRRERGSPHPCRDAP